PTAPLTAGRAYRLSVTRVRDTDGRIMNERGGRSRYDEELGYSLLQDGPPELPFTTTFTVGSMAADTTPPDTLIVAGPQGVSDHSTFVIASSEQAGRFECLTDGVDDWTPCSQETSGGGDGGSSETFRVRAVDTAGNRDPTPAQRSFRLV